MEQVNMLEFVEELMDMGYDEVTACREYNTMFNSDYNAEDYEKEI